MAEIFISYRRQDTATFSQWLAADLRRKFGEKRVFIDTRSLQGADVWAREIEQHLRDAKLVIVVIGRAWLAVRDQHDRRRIDDPADWVRREVETALAGGAQVLPLFVDGASAPAPEALPASLAALTDIQGRQIGAADIEQELADLEAAIARLIGRKAQSGPRLPFPSPGSLQIEPLDDAELEEIEAKLPGWSLIERSVNGREALTLTKTYAFESFEDAIHFMATASRRIGQIDHHPEWTNVWRSLLVHLTTWDIGGRPTTLDVDLASYLDQLHTGYARRVQPRG